MASIIDHAKLLLAALLLLAGGSRGALGAQGAARLLPAGTPRRGDAIGIGGPPARYRLAGMQPDSGYEVRVSLPGTNPVRVRLWLEPAQRGGGAGGHSRRLLDAEKVVFRTDSQGRAVAAGGQAADVMLAVERWGRWRQPQHAPQLLVYDIVLERSTLGVPHSALPLLAAALLLLAAAAAAVPRWTDAAVPRLLSWLGGGRAAAAAGVSMPAAGSRGRRAAARAAAR